MIHSCVLKTKMIARYINQGNKIVSSFMRINHIRRRHCLSVWMLCCDGWSMWLFFRITKSKLTSTSTAVVILTTVVSMFGYALETEKKLKLAWSFVDTLIMVCKAVNLHLNTRFFRIFCVTDNDITLLLTCIPIQN